METRPTRSRYERGRGRAAALRARGERLAEQAQEARKRHGSVDAAFEVVDRDAEVSGGIIAGALAYRFAPWAIAKQGTYGALGGPAAALLLGFFLLSRLMVGTAVLNATLWERRERTT